MPINNIQQKHWPEKKHSSAAGLLTKYSYFPSPKVILWAYLYFSFFTLGNGLVQHFHTNIEYSLAQLCMSLFLDTIFLLPVVLLPRILRAIWLVLLYPPLLTLGVANMIHVLVYRSTLSSFAIHSFLETTSGESWEFVSAHTTILNAILVIGIGFLPLLFMLKSLQAMRRQRLYHNTKAARFTTALIIIITLFASGAALQQGKSILHAHGMYDFYKAVKDYHKNMVKLLNKREEAKYYQFEGLQLLDVQTGKKTTEQRTYVLIIGESANRRHLGLYGYHRDTTPKLSAMQSELITFTDVISGATHTIPSLRKILLFPDHDPVNGNNGLSLINLFNRAGFKTFWLSNQIVSIDGKTGTSIIAGDCNQVSYINTSLSEGSSGNYDGELLPEIDEALNDSAGNKLIIVHLLGSHMTYSLRYPAEYNHYTNSDDLPTPAWGKNESPEFMQEAKDYINHYDNSIRYTDYVVHKIIRKVEANGGRSFVLYLSDHGQEVFGSRPIRGQLQNHPTKNMLDVPFILWLSPAYKDANQKFVEQLPNYKNRPFMLDGFVYSLAELARINFADTIHSQSIFSEQFQPRPRIVPNGDEYSSLE